MSHDHLSEFLESAKKSGLLSAADAATIGSQLRESGAVTKVDAAAKLVANHMLTPFQAEQLLAGRGGECMLAGRYVIRQKLGAGAMGAVYLAVDRKLDRAVAIKVLPEQSVTDEAAVARFQREAKALAKLSHPNIIQAYDSDQIAGRQFLVMEYAEGTNLGDLIRANGRIAPALAADYAYQAALGLQNAHEKGLVHRDLKPGNLLLTLHGQVKILDLGLARFLQDQVGDATLTREGSGMGTPDYMPPEQFHDARHVDARSDIYSLGCTLYHLIAGRVPFPGTSMSAKYDAHERHEPPPLEDFCPDVPAGLSLAIQRMMAKRPADRFQSAREVAEAVFPHVAGSSRAIVHIKATASWHGSQLGLSVVPIRVRRRRSLMIGSVVTAAALAVVAVSFWAGGAFRSQPTDSGAEPKQLAGDGGRKSQLGSTEPDDHNVLTVSQNGSSQFQTIREALDNAKPGMTIRVTDDASYAEEILLDDPSRHAGVRFEAPQQATILLNRQSRRAFTIRGVPRVSIDGFRFRSAGAHPDALCVVLSGKCPGVRLDRLDLQTNTWGIAAQDVNATPEEPVSISNCDIDVEMIGVSITGGGGGTSAARSSGFIVHSNRITGAFRGVQLQGLVRDIQITGNVIWKCSHAGIQFSDLAASAERILVANNTAFDNQSGFRVWDDPPFDEINPGQAEFRNNLFLEASGGDMAFARGSEGGLGSVSQEAGDAAIKTWQFGHNYRDLSGNEPTLPLAESDKKLEAVQFLSRDPAHGNFLRLPADSLLATGGAGGDLPTYVGAVPPEGVEPWDWRKTWEARYPKMLLTVSKDPKRVLRPARRRTRPTLPGRRVEAASLERLHCASVASVRSHGRCGNHPRPCANVLPQANGADGRSTGRWHPGRD